MAERKWAPVRWRDDEEESYLYVGAMVIATVFSSRPTVWFWSMNRDDGEDSPYHGATDREIAKAAVEAALSVVTEDGDAEV